MLYLKIGYFSKVSRTSFSYDMVVYNIKSNLIKIYIYMITC